MKKIVAIIVSAMLVAGTLIWTLSASLQSEPEKADAPDMVTYGEM